MHDNIKGTTGKLELEGRIIQQVTKFRYLGIKISGYGDVEVEVREQVSSEMSQYGETCTGAKAKVYKAIVRPTITRPNITKTKPLLVTTEMRVLRRITGERLSIEK